MSNAGPESFSLNPESFPVNLASTQEMIDSLNLINDGKNTEILSAKSILKEASAMYAGLKEIRSVGPEIGATMRELQDAIENLQQTIEGVD